MDDARRILRRTAGVLVLLAVLTAFPVLQATVRGQPDCKRQLLVGYDGFGYYAWLRSPLIDVDLEFADEFTQAQQRWHFTAELPPRTKTGLTTNYWSVGPAVAWTPAVLVVHGFVSVTGWFPADGYSPLYQLAVAASTLGMSLLGLLLTYRIARRFTDELPAALTASVVALASPIINYAAVETSMAHGLATTLLAAVILAWLTWRDDVTARRAMVLGLLIGFTAATRWQLAGFAMLPVVDAIIAVLRRRWTVVAFIGRTIAFLLGTVIGFAPQMLAWKIVAGDWIAPTHGTNANWLSPDFTQVLLTWQKGYFTWTPLAAIGFVATIVRVLRGVIPIMLLLAALAQVYAVAVLLGPGVFLGGSFGFRLLTETTVALVPGIALFIQAGMRRNSSATIATILVLIVWNVLLLGVYRFGLAQYTGGPPPETVRAFAHYFVARPLDAVLMMLGIVWLARGIAVAQTVRPRWTMTSFLTYRRQPRP